MVCLVPVSVHLGWLVLSSIYIYICSCVGLKTVTPVSFWYSKKSMPPRKKKFWDELFLWTDTCSLKLSFWQNRIETIFLNYKIMSFLESGRENQARLRFVRRFSWWTMWTMVNQRSTLYWIQSGLAIEAEGSHFSQEERKCNSGVKLVIRVWAVCGREIWLLRRLQKGERNFAVVELWIILWCSWMKQLSVSLAEILVSCPVLSFVHNCLILKQKCASASNTQ